VLPPIATSDWNVDELDERIGDVRDQFIETLERWPGSSTRPL
jgi:hypothetical protein